MKKDVIYIDVEDDITSIIEKVKSAHEKIIALVPPKRGSVLQSAVNLKLLHRVAKSSDRRLVLITADKALASLAAGVHIPVAKTLQSRPELANIAEAPDTSDEEVINGNELPVGELQKTVPPKPTDDEEIILPDSLIGEEAKSVAPVKAKKKGASIPNFDSFRKRLFLIIGGLLLLIIFLVWAIFLAPHAEVNIKAKTSSVDVSLPINLVNTGAATNPTQGVIKPLVQEIKKTDTADFTSTGKKDVGEKASGTVTINNCGDSDPITIPGGTAVSSDGLNFLTASSVKVDAAKFSGGQCIKAGTASVAVSAQNVGEQYNLKKSSIFTVAGQSSGVSASNPNAFAGGSKRQVTVVSDSDVAAAVQKITSQDQAPVRQELSAKFDKKKTIIINESFMAVPGSTNINPLVGSEAANGRVTIETTYTIFGLDRKEAGSTLEAYLKNTLKNKKNQRVYDNGLKKLKVNKYAANESGGSVKFETQGLIGPTIDAAKLKPSLVGKNYEEIRQIIQGVDGVEDVDTKFSPFWVGSVNDEKKIDIKFSVSTP